MRRSAKFTYSAWRPFDRVTSLTIAIIRCVFPDTRSLRGRGGRSRRAGIQVREFFGDSLRRGEPLVRLARREGDFVERLEGTIPVPFRNSGRLPFRDSGFRLPASALAREPLAVILPQEPAGPVAEGTSVFESGHFRHFSPSRDSLARVSGPRRRAQCGRSRREPGRRSRRSSTDRSVPLPGGAARSPERRPARRTPRRSSNRRSGTSRRP